jgi:hypothetical protein
MRYRKHIGYILPASLERESRTWTPRVSVDFAAFVREVIANRGPQAWPPAPHRAPFDAVPALQAKRRR